MLAIENQMYNILVDLHNQEKQITLCKVPTHIEIKGNEEADKAAKQAIDISGMTMTKLPRIENNTSKLHYIKPCIEEWESAQNRFRQYEFKLSRIHIRHT